MRFKVLILLMAWLAQDAAVWADGGVVRFSERRGYRRITVFTTPTPLRAGPIDISVLLQDVDSGKPLTETPIMVLAHPVHDPLTKISAAATTEAATNKLMRAAPLVLSEPGWWHVDVIVEGETIGFDMEVGAAMPVWLDMSLWIGWPFAAVAIFAFHQWFVRGRTRVHVSSPPSTEG